MKPTIGRIVHYRFSNNEVFPGIITRVSPDEGTVWLTCFTPNGHVIQAAPIEPWGVTGTMVETGRWFWPPRES